MTEEVVVNTEEVVDAPQLTEVEQEAYKEGWRPEDEFTGDKTRWVPADEFMRRKPLFGKIDELKSENYHTRKELQEVKQTLKALSEHHKKVREIEYDRAIKELQAQKRDALDDRDSQTVIETDEKIAELKEEKKQFDAQMKQEQQANVQPTPEYVEWIKDNGWYQTDQELHDAADAFAYTFVQRNKGATPGQVYAAVSERIMKVYPEKFQSRSKPSPVESGASTSRPSSKTSGYKLTPEEEAMARSFERSGVMTRAEYIAELKKLDERKQ